MSRALKFVVLTGLLLGVTLGGLCLWDAGAAADAAVANALGLDGADHAVRRAFPLLSAAAAAALSFGLCWTAVELRHLLTKLTLALAATVEVGTLAALLTLFGVYFSPLYPAAAALLATAAGLAFSYGPPGRRQRLVRATFERRVSSQVARVLTDGRVVLDDARRGVGRDLTVVACEIFNHDELMAALEPPEYVRLVNECLGRAAAALVERGGCLVACDGEGVRAIFGEPLPTANHAAAACRAALEVVRRVRAAPGDPPPAAARPAAGRNGANGSTTRAAAADPDHGPAWSLDAAPGSAAGTGAGPAGGGRDEGGLAAAVPAAAEPPRCDLRVGVNSGEMIVGRFGSEERLGGGSYGVAGEEVAFARRLCAANLIYGSTVLVGARTYELAEGEVEARPLELLRRRDDGSWIEVYELLNERGQVTPEERRRRDLFWTGVIYYREKRLGAALEKFRQARVPGGAADQPLDFYIHRVEQLQALPAARDGERAQLTNSF